MDSLRSTTPGLDGFQLPADDASRAEWEHAFEQMRAIKLTWQQVQRGYGVSVGDDGAFGDIMRLRAWYEEQGLLPADVAAEAILVRMTPVMERLAMVPDFGPVEAEKLAMDEMDVRSDVIQFAGAEPWQIKAN